MMYRKQRTVKDGIEHITYFKDDQPVGPEEVPREIIDSDDWGNDIEFIEGRNPDEDFPSPPPPEPEPVVDKKCIFCGEPTKIQRFIHMQTVYICEEDNNTKSMGTIGAKVKELQYG